MFLSRSTVRDIDRRCIEEFHIPGIVLMENASRGVAEAAGEELISLTGKPAGNIVILCGGGNNGGDGMAAARHLHNRGNVVRIGLATDPAKHHRDAAINWQIVQAMRLPTFDATPDAIRALRADLIIDAIFGTGLTQPPRDPFAAIVAAVEETAIAVLAVDLPSGLDCDTGQPLGKAIKARRTVTFVAAKARLRQRQFGGSTPDRVTVADIGYVRVNFRW